MQGDGSYYLWEAYAYLSNAPDGVIQIVVVAQDIEKAVEIVRSRTCLEVYSIVRQNRVHAVEGLVMED